MLYTFSGQEKNKLRMRDLPYLGFKFIIRFRCRRVGGAPRPFLINDIRKWCAVRTLQGCIPKLELGNEQTSVIYSGMASQVVSCVSPPGRRMVTFPVLGEKPIT